MPTTPDGTALTTENTPTQGGDQSLQPEGVDPTFEGFIRPSEVFGDKSSLPKAEAPSDVSQISKAGEIQLPGGEPDVISGTPAISFAKGESARDAVTKAEEDSRLEDKGDDKKGFLRTVLGGSDRFDDARRTTERTTGVDFDENRAAKAAAFAQMEALAGQQANLIKIRDEQVAEAMGRPGSTINFANNRVAQIQRNAAPQINQLTAMMNVQASKIAQLNDDFGLATQFLNSAVQAATSEDKFKLDMYQTFQQDNQFEISRLDKKEQDALDRAHDFVLVNYREAVKNAYDQFGGDDMKRITDFNDAASEFVVDMANSEDMDWGTAWNAMRSRFPEFTNEDIDEALNKAANVPFDDGSGGFGSFVGGTLNKLFPVNREEGTSTTRGSFDRQASYEKLFPGLKDADPLEGIKDAYQIVKDQI